MLLASFLGITVLAALATAASTSDEYIAMSPDVLLKKNFVYKRDRDIVSILVPLNGVNLDKDEKADISTFFIEADIKDNGEKEYKGAYLLKDKKATKILETGTDLAADYNRYSKNVFISATDGLYVYNSDLGKVKRYGSVTDNLIGVVKMNSNDVLYVLTADNVVYKVTDKGKKKVKVDGVKGAKQIILDNFDNLYYYGNDNRTYVVREGIVKKIEGIPDGLTNVNLAKPPFILDGLVIFSSGDKRYYVKNDGTSSPVGGDILFKDTPSASSSEAVFIIYYAHNKQIYEYKFPNLNFLDDIRKEFKDKTDKIQSVVTRIKAARQV